MKKPIHNIQIIKHLKDSFIEIEDTISVEEPLEIIVAYGSAEKRKRKVFP